MPFFGFINRAFHAWSKDVAREAGEVPAEPTPEIAPKARRINKAGLELIKAFEGVRLKAYLCPAKVWTIGFGSTGPHVKPGMEITMEEAEALLRSDLSRFERGVEKAVEGVETSDNEFAAFVSLAFNIGLRGFEKSTALRRHLAGNKRGAADAILLWNKARGVVLKGLIRRREAERELYLS